MMGHSVLSRLPLLLFLVVLCNSQYVLPTSPPDDLDVELLHSRNSTSRLQERLHEDALVYAPSPVPRALSSGSSMRRQRQSRGATATKRKCNPFSWMAPPDWDCVAGIR